MTQPYHPSPIDRAALLKRCLNTTALANELLALFSRDLPATLTELSTAFAQNQGEQARRLAHKIKGNALTIGADELAATARAFELAPTQTQLNAVHASAIRALDDAQHQLH